MQLLELLLVLCLSFEAISATARDNGKDVSFSVDKVWQSYQKKDNKCDNVDDPKWKVGVQECFDGCNDVSETFHGKALELGGTVMGSFEKYLTKQIYLTNSNSTVLQSSAEESLLLVAKCNNLNRSALNVMTKYGKHLPDLMPGFKGIVTKLSPHIQICSFNEAFDELGCVLSTFIKEFLRSCRLTGCKNAVDFEPTLKKLRKLMNAVSIIAESTLNNSEATQEEEEAVAVLIFIFWYSTIVVQGMNSCAIELLTANKCVTSQTTTSVSISFDYVLETVTEAGSDIVLPFNESIKDFLSIFVNLTMALNKAVSDILGIFDSVALTVADITKNLYKKQRSTILKGCN